MEQAVAGGSPRAAAALRANARALGEGIGGLVNAHDPELVTVSGFGVSICDFAPDVVAEAYRQALMSVHRDDPPVVASTRLGARGPLIGAMELVFDAFLTPEGIRAWTARG